MDPTISHRSPGDVPPPSTAGPARALRRAARLAVVTLFLWVVIDVLRTTIAVGYHEERVTVVTHDGVDVLPAWLLYGLLAYQLPLGMVTTVADRTWIFGSILAAAAFVTWLHQAWRNAGRRGGALAWKPRWATDRWSGPVAGLAIPYLLVRAVRGAGGPTAAAAPAGRWWVSVLVTVLLHSLSWLYQVLTSAGGALAESALDRRAVAYPLWTAATVLVVITSVLSTRVVRRITEGQQRSAPVGPAPPMR